MKHSVDFEKYQIKVKRAPKENEKLFPYSKYLKNNYSQLSKIAPKNSILYKLKINPEIIINEYHETSNNINTNINIKENHSKNKNINNNNNDSNINIINYKDQPNNFSFKKIYVNDNDIKDENNNNDRYFYDKHIENYNYYSKNINVPEKRIKIKNNNSGVLSPFVNKNNTNNKILENYKSKNYAKDIKCSQLYKNNDLAAYSYIFHSPLNDARNNRIKYSNTDRDFYNNKIINNDNSNNNINKKYLYSNYNQNFNPQKKNYSLDLINASNALQYKGYIRQKSPSINIYNIIEKPNYYRGESSIESFRNKKLEEKSDEMLSSNNKINNNFGNIQNNNINNNYSSKNIIDNNKDTLNIKLENYRIKLFKVFMNHFMYFIHRIKRKNFDFFLKKLRIYKYKNESNYIYNRKNYFNNNIDNLKQGQTHLIKRVNRNDLNLLDIFKSSTVKDYYKFYNKLKQNHNINPNLKQIFNSSLINNELDETQKTRILNKSLSDYYKNKSLLNSAPRLYNDNNLSLKRNQIKKGKVLNSKSPAFSFGNRTIINNDISFANEGNKKENELFRDSKELSKKYEQIQRRKKKSQNKSKDLNQEREKNVNKSADVKRITNSNEYNEFNELRKNVQMSQIENSKKKKTIDVDRKIRDKPQNKGLIKTCSFKDNISNICYNNTDDITQNKNNYKTIDNKSEENNQNRNDYKYKTRFYYSNTNKDKNKKFTIKDNYEFYNKSKEGMQNKMIERAKIKNKLLNKKAVKKQNNINNINNINYVNKNKEVSYKKVKVNINKKYKIGDQQNEQTRKYNNYYVIKQVPKTTNQFVKNNIYYSKKSTKRNMNISLLIKNIVTKDNRIHININYYKYSPINNYTKRNFNSLQMSENISICLIGEQKSEKIKMKLYSIKEEEMSYHTSKIYDESATFGLNTNTLETRKNNIICYPNELVYKRFIDIIDRLLKHFSKKYFLKRIKSIYVENKKNNKKNDYNNKSEDKKESKVYKKKGAVNNKIAGEIKNSVINKKKEKKYKEKIKNFRIMLIKYVFGFSN